MIRYFSGTALGSVMALASQSFVALCAEVIAKPVQLPLTRAAYHALPKRDKKAPMDQERAKRSRYLTPAAFTESPSPRKTEHATHCNLLALDVDDSEVALRLLDRGWDALGDLGFIVWHTATSTSEKPRLRVLVHADAIPVARYRDAVLSVAGLLGVEANSESLVAVQAMYLPVQFKGEKTSPIVAQSKPDPAHPSQDDSPFLVTDITSSADAEEPVTAAVGPVGDLEFLKSPMDGLTVADVKTALEVLDPDMPMQRWIEVAAALKHQFAEEGFALWDEWSAKGEKYPGTEELGYRWGTLRANTPNRQPITIRSLLKAAKERGWTNEALTRCEHAALSAWIRSPQRATEELMDEAPLRIAKASPMLGQLERKVLMAALREVLAAREMPLSLPDIRKEVHRLEVEAVRQTGLPPWAKGVCFVTSGNYFYRFTTDRRFAPEVIDLLHTVASVGDDTPMRPRDYLIQVAAVPAVENLRYEPRQPGKRFFQDEGVPYVNTYRPSYPTPDRSGAEAAGDLFMAHMTHLIAESDYRTLLVDFMAYIVQKPGVKIRWVPLIQSGEGAGKTFLADVMAAVSGRGNVAKLAGSNVLEGVQNDWAYGHQLVAIEEIRVIGHNRHAVMDKLKPCISDDRISLRCMYERPRTVPNITNYLMFTNYQDSLAVNENSRRYFVLQSPLQQEGQIAELGGPAYFDPLFLMLRDNAAGLRSWFEQWTISPAFNPDGRAPVTPYLRELAENSANPLTYAVRQAIADEADPLVRSDLLSIRSLRNEVQKQSGVGEFSDQHLCQVLRELGWRQEMRVRIDEERHTLWTHKTIANPAHVAKLRAEFL